MTPEEEQLDRQLDRLSPAQLCAFLYNDREIGPDRLRQMLADAVRTTPLAREHAEKWADELMELGLVKAAKLIEDFSQTEAHRRQREERKHKLKLRSKKG